MKKIILLTVIICVFLSLMACGDRSAQSADELSMVQMFPITNRTNKDKEITERFYEQIATIIDQSQTVDGVTVTLNGALSDEKNLLLSFTLHGRNLEDFSYSQLNNKDTGVLSKNLIDVFKSIHPDINNEQFKNFVGWGNPFDRNRSQYIYDKETKTAQMLLYFPYNSKNGTEYNLHMENIYHVDNILLEGPYDFTFTLKPNVTTCHYVGSIDLKTEDGKILTITTATISAFSLEIDYTCSTHYPSNWFSTNELNLTSIRVKGKELEPSDTTGLIIKETETGMTGSFTFDNYSEPIDPSTVEAVCIGDTWLELTDLTPYDKGVS